MEEVIEIVIGEASMRRVVNGNAPTLIAQYRALRGEE
jgi:hypothetical protein